MSKADELGIICANITPEILCLTETWLSSEVSSNFLAIKGYTLVRSDRTHKRGGGTAIYIRDEISFEAISCTNYFKDVAEGTCVDLLNSKLILLCMYIPPNSTADALTLIEEDICGLVDAQLTRTPDRELIILGDFNKFDVKLLTTNLCLTDIVVKPTRGCNILDHILISQPLMDTYSPSNVSYNPPIGKSDHLTHTSSNTRRLFS